MNTTKLLESGSATGTGKRRRAKLISANVWGSSAYYPAEVLARDASVAFPVGTKMFENHLTESETYERPVGDVGKLVGKLISTGVYEEDNPEGPGVYADVEFYDSYVDRINEIGDDVGLSVAGSADYVEGERDGRFGKIVTSIQHIKSVDVVVAAGAGGKLVSILESARLLGERTTTSTEGDQSVTALTKEDFEAGIASLVEGLTTTIKDSLTPVAPAVDAEVEAPAATAVETPAAVEPQAEVSANVAPEIDHVELATKFAQSELPSAVMPSVISAIKEGASVDEAIKAQLVIKEAFQEQVKPGTVRIVESGNENDTNLDFRAQVLNAIHGK